MPIRNDGRENDRALRGRISRMNDTDFSNAPLNGDALVYNESTKKWEPKQISTSGSQTILGNPTDGAWEDGINSWTETTKIADAFDDVNEILAQLAPANAESLQSKSLTGGPTKYTGKIPAGLNTNWYASGKVAGDTVADLVKTTNGTFNSPNSTTTFNYADQGLLKLYINGNLKATIDLGANFNEANRNGNQVISAYDIKGLGDTIVDGRVTFTEGSFAITSVGKYNNFTKWQKGIATVVLNQPLGEGYNEMYLVHEVSSGNQTTNKFIMFHDNDTNNMVFSQTPTVVEDAVTGTHLSGVKYYTIGDKFNVSYIVDNLFAKAYHATKVSEYSMPGVTAVTKNPATVPNYNDNFVVNELITINQSNIIANNARLAADARDPYSTIVTSNSPSEGRLVLTYGQRSTNVAEYFTDEVYRLPLNFDFTSKTAAITGAWDSTLALTNGNAQAYLNGSGNAALVYPTTNFSTGFLPVNTANYSTFTGNQQFARAFVASTPKSSVTITLNGIAAGLGQVGQGDVNVEIKLPGLSGWGDALKAYDSTASKTADGWGMLSGSVSYTGGNAVLTATFGGFSTIDSGNRIYVRVTLRNGTRFITSMSVGW